MATTQQSEEPLNHLSWGLPFESMKHIKRIVRATTRWAWQPIIREFAARERTRDQRIRMLEEHLWLIGFGKPHMPQMVARKALEKK